MQKHWHGHLSSSIISNLLVVNSYWLYAFSETFWIFTRYFKEDYHLPYNLPYQSTYFPIEDQLKSKRTTNTLFVIICKMFGSVNPNILNCITVCWLTKWTWAPEMAKKLKGYLLNMFVFWNNLEKEQLLENFTLRI